MAETSSHSSAKQFHGLERALKFSQVFFSELWKGVATRTLPWHICCSISAVFAVAFAMRWDAFVWKAAHAARWYPFRPSLYWAYVSFCLLLSFLSWAFLRACARRRLEEKLTTVFQNAGLVTRTKKKPGFISDEKMDNDLRRLVVTSAGLPRSEFMKAKDFLAAELQVYIDEIRPHIDRGIVEILYSYEEMPHKFHYDSNEVKTPLKFKVGDTRSGPLYVSLRDVPHLLVGGHTVAGKSTFLRQALTTLTLNSPGAEFTMIDLKGGVELKIFKGLPNVKFYDKPLEAIEALKYAESQIDKRLALLALNRATDLDAYFRIPEENRKIPPEWPLDKKPSRHIVVIDEAAELLMANVNLGAKEAQVAKRLAARIAALGRAVGIHLIVATQRPDRNAVDPLIKANLPGRLCFQMSDNASSMTILDSVRAADLPAIKGRAVWRNGLDLIEVQVPWIDPEDAEPLIAPRRKVENGPSALAARESRETPIKESPALAPKDEIDVHEQAKSLNETLPEESLS